MNEDPKARLIRELREEIERLRSAGGGDSLSDMQEIIQLRNALKVREITVDGKRSL